MAELVLLDAGWNATSLGHMLPFATLREVITADQPKLMWLSVSVIRDEDRFVEEMASLFETARNHGTAVTIGGRSLGESLRKRLRYTSFCDSFRHLEDFSRELRSVQADSPG